MISGLFHISVWSTSFQIKDDLIFFSKNNGGGYVYKSILVILVIFLVIFLKQKNLLQRWMIVSTTNTF